MWQGWRCGGRCCRRCGRGWWNSGYGRLCYRGRYYTGRCRRHSSHCAFGSLAERRTNHQRDGSERHHTTTGCDYARHDEYDWDTSYAAAPQHHWIAYRLSANSSAFDVASSDDFDKCDTVAHRSSLTPPRTPLLLLRSTVKLQQVEDFDSERTANPHLRQKSTAKIEGPVRIESNGVFTRFSKRPANFHGPPNVFKYTC